MATKTVNINSGSVINELSNVTSDKASIDAFKKIRCVNEDIVREYMQAKQSGTIESQDDKGNKASYDDYIDSIDNEANRMTKKLIDFLDTMNCNSINQLYQSYYPKYMDKVEQGVQKLQDRINESNVDADASNISSLEKLGDVIKKIGKKSFKEVSSMFEFGGKKIVKFTNILSMQSQFIGAIALVVSPFLLLIGGAGIGASASSVLYMMMFILAGRMGQMGTESIADIIDIRVATNIV